MHPTRLVAPSLLLVLLIAVASCHSSPTQPSPRPEWRDLVTFGELVGTSWIGTATFAATTREPLTTSVSLSFLWGAVCDVPGWCAQGYNPFGWGTTDDVRTRIRGDQTASGYWRDLDVGDQLQQNLGAAEGAGHWERARLSGDSQRLEIVSSDFAWRDRRGVTYQLTRAPWPSNVNCPSLVSCR